MSGLQLRQGDAHSLIVSLGVGANGEIKAGGLMNAQRANFYVGDAKVVGVFDRADDSGIVAIELSVAAG